MKNILIALFNDRSEQGFRLVYSYLPLANQASRKGERLFPPKTPSVKFFPIKKGETPEAVRLLEF